LWVSLAVLTVRQSLPVYLDKQTFSESVGMSQKCNKRHRAATEGRLLFSFAEQLAGENIDEVHLSDDDKPLD
jgi:hypothetical protein